MREWCWRCWNGPWAPGQGRLSPALPPQARPHTGQISSAQFFLGNFWGRGHTSASSLDRKVLARGSKLFPSSESSEVSCGVLGFPCQGKGCDAKGKQCREGLLKGMMLPAVVSESFSTRVLTKLAQAGEEEGENDNWLPSIDRFSFEVLFSFISVFIRENGELPRVYRLPMALVVCHLLKNAFTRRQSVW